MNQEYQLAELTKEEGEALTKDLQEVLAKHNAELGVSSTINLLKRVPTGNVPSPAEFLPDGPNPETTSSS